MRLVLKYRPNHLHETGTDETSKAVLKCMLKSARVRVLVTGDVGSGKTALLRVLEQHYYDGPPPDAAVFRISAHGEKTVGQQRADLRTFCRTRGPWRKLVVMDDAEHVAPTMQHAVQACVETHGDEIMFMCACTQIQRVAAGLRAHLIAVRTHHLSVAALASLQDRVCAEELLDLAPEAKNHVLTASGTSARALLQHLEKLRLHGGHVDLDLAQRCCSAVHPAALDRVTQVCGLADGGCTAARELYRLHDVGHSVMDLLDAYFAYVKTAPIPDRLRYPIIRLIAHGMRDFYDEHDDEIVLAVFARRMNSLMRGRSGDQEVLA